MTISVLVADDEPLARRKLAGLIAEVPDLTCVGETADGPATALAIDRLKPDVAFLDIRMPELSGLDVLAQIRHRPRVIFTTAHDSHALAAFELGALDYLLKPFGRERFLAAVERAREALGQGGERDKGDDGVPEEVDRARGLISSKAPLERLFIRERGRIVPVAVKDIRWIEARADYVALHLPNSRPLVRVPIGDLAARLDPARFVRIHRSMLVNMDHVVALVDQDDGRLQVQLIDGTKLLASRTKSKDLRDLAI